MLTFAAKLPCRRFPIGCWHNTICVPVQRDRRHRNGRLRGESLLKLLIHGIADSKSKAMAIGMNDDLHIIGVVEGAGVLIERCLVKVPGGRIASPENLCNLTSVSRQSGASALGLEIVLIPDTRFDRR